MGRSSTSSAVAQSTTGSLILAAGGNLRSPDGLNRSANSLIRQDVCGPAAVSLASPHVRSHAVKCQQASLVRQRGLFVNVRLGWRPVLWIAGVRRYLQRLL